MAQNPCVLTALNEIRESVNTTPFQNDEAQIAFPALGNAPIKRRTRETRQESRTAPQTFLVLALQAVKSYSRMINLSMPLQVSQLLQLCNVGQQILLRPDGEGAALVLMRPTELTHKMLGQLWPCLSLLACQPRLRMSVSTRHPLNLPDMLEHKGQHPTLLRMLRIQVLIWIPSVLPLFFQYPEYPRRLLRIHPSRRLLHLRQHLSLIRPPIIHTLMLATIKVWVPLRLSLQEMRRTRRISTLPLVHQGSRSQEMRDYHLGGCPWCLPERADCRRQSPHLRLR